MSNTINEILKELDNKILQLDQFCRSCEDADIVAEKEIELRDLLKSSLNRIASETEERVRKETLNEIIYEFGDYNNGCGCCAEQSLEKAIKSKYEIQEKEKTE